MGIWAATVTKISGPDAVGSGGDDVDGCMVGSGVVVVAGVGQEEEVGRYAVEIVGRGGFVRLLLVIGRGSKHMCGRTWHRGVSGGCSVEI
ncbi:proline-rich receptor-like protein kinase PERK2 [Iris pallida]|uniref:Proline-rich receptor-like protein kinase PERK2 n=1 Tax=Iris pallida TaxID=29817 RepID=A0AAX6FNF0_IRIPA|nr:proline-rich receptor-like protein kinase PERK2 [Iris pallida]